MNKGLEQGAQVTSPYGPYGNGNPAVFLFQQIFQVDSRRTCVLERSQTWSWAQARAAG